jgi:hypothetical protein
MHVFHGKFFATLPGWHEQLKSIGLAENVDWTTLSSDQTVSGSYHTTSNYCFELQDGSTVYFKRYVYRRIRLKHWLQPSKAAVEAAGFSELKALNIPTLDTIAYGEHRRFGLLTAAFIATSGMSNVIQLDQFLARQWIDMSRQARAVILKQLQAILIEQLHSAHDAGFYHWDLKLRNILLQNNPGKPQLIWIDCPRSRRQAANHFNSVITDLAAMARVGCRVLTPGQQMRFLLDYSNNDRTYARRLFRSIAQQLEKRPPRPLWQLLARDHPEFIRNKKLQENVSKE